MRTSYEWTFNLGQVVTSLIRAGLRIEEMREYPYTCFNPYPSLVKECDDGLFRWRDPNVELPLMFSIRATKE